MLANRKEKNGGPPRTRNRRELGDGDNDIPPDQGEHKIWGLHWLFRAMSVVDLYLLDFCLGFSTGRYIYFWTVLKEDMWQEDSKGSEGPYSTST